MTLESFRWIGSPAVAACAEAAASKASAHRIFMEFPKEDDRKQQKCPGGHASPPGKATTSPGTKSASLILSE